MRGREVVNQRRVDAEFIIDTPLVAYAARPIARDCYQMGDLETGRLCWLVLAKTLRQPAENRGFFKMFIALYK